MLAWPSGCLLRLHVGRQQQRSRCEGNTLCLTPGCASKFEVQPYRRTFRLAAGSPLLKTRMLRNPARCNARGFTNKPAGIGSVIGGWREHGGARSRAALPPGHRHGGRSVGICLRPPALAWQPHRVSLHALASPKEDGSSHPTVWIIMGVSGCGKRWAVLAAPAWLSRLCMLHWHCLPAIFAGRQAGAQIGPLLLNALPCLQHGGRSAGRRSGLPVL